MTLKQAQVVLITSLVGWLLTGAASLWGFAYKDATLHRTVKTLKTTTADHEARIRKIESRTRDYEVLLTEIRAARRDIERLRDAVGLPRPSFNSAALQLYRDLILQGDPFDPGRGGQKPVTP